MTDPKEDRLFEELAVESEGEPEERAGARLKSRLYTALVRRQAESGPIESLSSTRASGRPLCVFEQLVQIAPVGKRAKSVFICNTCHARILAEHLEDPPIWWPHCPYSEFRKS